MKKLFFIVALVSVAACKDPKNSDGPQFRLQSQGVTMSAVSSQPLVLKRANLDDGPVIQIEVKDPANVSQSSREINCSGYILKGRTVFYPDTTMFDFKISNAEFPGLKTLPINPLCKLAVTLQNYTGSKSQKEFELKLAFDSNPELSIRRMALAKGQNYHFQNGFIPLEGYEITNTFNYTIGVTLYLGAFYSDFSTQPQLSQQYFLRAFPDKITLGGKYELVDLTDRTASIRIAPGDHASIYANYTKPTDIPANTTLMIQTFLERVTAPTISMFKDIGFMQTDKMGLNMYGTRPDQLFPIDHL